MKDESLDTSTARTTLFFLRGVVSRSGCTVIKVQDQAAMARVQETTDCTLQAGDFVVKE